MLRFPAIGFERHSDEAKNKGKDFVAWNSLISSFASIGNASGAKNAFDAMPGWTIVSWNALLDAYARKGQQLRRMESLLGAMPEWNVVSWTIMLKAFTNECQIDSAVAVFDSMQERSLISWTIFLQAYAARSGHLAQARNVFERMPQHDAVSCNVMLVAFSQAADPASAKRVFDSMRQWSDVSWISLLAAFARNGNLEGAKNTFDTSPFRNLLLSTAMLQAFAQSCHIDQAQDFFDTMPEWDLVAWNSLLSAFAQAGELYSALLVFRKMPVKDIVSWTSLLRACSRDPATASIIFHSMPQRDIVAWTSILEIYSQAGELGAARSTFDRMPELDTICWTAMIFACSRSSAGEQALELYALMQMEGWNPNGVTCLNVLAACAHLGLVDRCQGFLGSMILDHGLSPGIEHISCAIDLLGRMGRLEQAEELLRAMPFSPDAAAIRALLSSSRTHRDVDRARRRARSSCSSLATIPLLSNAML